MLTLLMNLGWLFESYVIHVTRIIGVFSNEIDNHYLPYKNEVMILIKGFSIGVILILIENSFNKWRNENNLQH